MNRRYIDIEDAETLVLRTDQAPKPGPDEMLIEVDFAGINRADVLQRMGLYPVPEDASAIMGLEVAGTVCETGANVSAFKPGDVVCALVHGGGYASHAIAREDHTLHLPENLSTKEGAALPEALLTVWHNVFHLGQLQPGETLLIHGGGSGIGSMGIQMALAHGAKVISTAGGPEKCQRVRDLGAEFVGDYRGGDLLEQLTTAGYGGKIDVILDIAGGDFVPINLGLAAPDARIVCIGVMRGAQATVDLFQILMKRLTVTGSTLRGMGSAGRAEGFSAIRDTVLPWVKQNTVAPIIDKVWPLADAMEAQLVMQTGSHFGKLILDCRD
ncbi:MAG: NAD(P)H-quinone oxidoreductase [Luminiphilus sp.]|nr:NAD(P)H-quinone oxidoreductase [Luminiphilus sp.]